jgi:hypothetical protein
MTKAGRIPCVVPFCRRTAPLEPGDSAITEVICGKHWQMAPLKMRKVLRRIERRAEVEGRTDELISRHWRCWDRIKRAIQEAATRP